MSNTTPTAAENYPLNVGQKSAAEKFMQFLFSDAKEMIISGPGGVGKTHLMGYMIDHVLPRYHKTCELMGVNAEYTSVVMTATTNKAVEELGKATGRPATTIYSFMNLKVQDDYSNGTSKVSKTRQWTVHCNKVIFVDESSMVDTTLRNLILEGTFKCKIIYVGDSCQLAPVKEPISPIYRADLEECELTEPMRTKCPHLQNLNHIMRERVKAKEFGDIQLVPGIIDWLDGPAMEQAIHENFISNNTADRVMAYRNDRVHDFNDHIRGLRGLSHLYTVGENLVCNTAYQPPMKMGAQLVGLSVETPITVVEASETIEKIIIAPKVELEIQRLSLRNQYGVILEDVPVPVDREHLKQLLKYYANQQDWPQYFRLKNEYPDIRPRDACTVYKSQGSTYDTAFIDLGDIGGCNRPDIVLRMLYVAVSRARTRVVFYGDLPAKYGRLVY